MWTKKIGNSVEIELEHTSTVGISPKIEQKNHTVLNAFSRGNMLMRENQQEQKKNEKCSNIC